MGKSSHVQPPKNFEIEELEVHDYSVQTGVDEESGAQVSEVQDLVVRSTKISVTEKVSFFEELSKDNDKVVAAQKEDKKDKEVTDKMPEKRSSSSSSSSSSSA